MIDLNEKLLPTAEDFDRIRDAKKDFDANSWRECELKNHYIVLARTRPIEDEIRLFASSIVVKHNELANKIKNNLIDSHKLSTNELKTILKYIANNI